jgi:hypothetical protein
MCIHYKAEVTRIPNNIYIRHTIQAMTDNRGFDYLSSSALSLTVAANTGISPFLTLFLLGLIEFWNSDLLNMGGFLDTILASWWSLILLALLALGEILCKCIPTLDEAIDSVEVFVVPILSVVATLGLLPSPSGESENDFGSENGLVAVGNATDGYRYLQKNNTVDDKQPEQEDFGAAFLIVLKVLLVVGGMVLSLLMHFFKMILRVSSLLCSGGCCRPCITILEVGCVCFGIVFAILWPIFAI